MFAPLLKRLDARRADRYRRTSASSRDRQFGGLYPPAPEAVIIAAEEKLGFPLPSLLREIYAGLANGGFGPGYGLIGLAGGYSVDDLEDRSLMEHYLYNRATAEQYPEDAPWPERLLDVCYLGCQGTYAIDCSQPDYPVIFADGGKLKETAMTFTELMERWADGKA